MLAIFGSMPLSTFLRYEYEMFPNGLMCYSVPVGSAVYKSCATFPDRVSLEEASHQDVTLDNYSRASYSGQFPTQPISWDVRRLGVPAT